MIDVPQVPPVYSRLSHNPLCTLLYEDSTRRPEDWEEVYLLYKYLLRHRCEYIYYRSYNYYTAFHVRISCQDLKHILMERMLAYEST